MYIHRKKTISHVLLIFWLFMSSWVGVHLTLTQIHASFSDILIYYYFLV